MNTKKRSCDRCYRRKEQCVGFPCEGCQQDTVTCEITRLDKKVGRPKVPKKGSTRRAYSRNGCIPCRKQKKKCDEGQPSCGPCAHRARPCFYKTRESGVGRQDNPMIAPVSDPVTGSSVNLAIPSSNVASGLKLLISAMSPLTEATKNAQTFELETNSQTPPTHSSDSVAPLDPGSGSSRDYIAPSPPVFDGELLTPTAFFNSMEQSFFDCLQNKTTAASVASIHSSPSELTRDEYSERKINLMRLCSLNSSGIPENEGELLCYFIRDVSMLLFADKATPRFLDTVIPLCLSDEHVRYPILAMSSSHKRNRSDTTNQEAVRDAAKFRAMAQFCLAGKNDGFYDDSENVLLSICLLSIQEIFEGNSLYWNSALEKGAEIIQARGGLQKVSKSSPLSIQLFCYLDHISSLSTCITPHVDRSKTNPYENYNGNQVQDILNCKFGFRFGIAGELFKIMGNISTLASLRKDRYKTAAHGRQFDTLANMIEMELQNWSPSLEDVTSNFSIDGSSDSGRSAISSYLLAVQWSSFLRLHQIIEGYDRSDSRVLACLSILLESLKSLQGETKIEPGLLYPLIMAGSVCVEQEDRDYILSRVRSIKGRLRFSYIGEFEKLLLAVWDQDETFGDAVNWASIRYYQFPCLVMF